LFQKRKKLEISFKNGLLEKFDEQMNRVYQKNNTAALSFM